MITAFKPSKPDRPRTHCLKQRKRMKKRIFCSVNDKNSKRNTCSYSISKTYCHLGYKKWRTFHNWLYKTSEQHVLKSRTSTQHTLQQSNTTCHLPHEWHTMMYAISNHDFNTKPYVKSPRYDKTSR